jgi:hypothetical protein
MPHYHFNFTDGHRTIVDEEGEKLPNKRAARRQAIRSAADAVRHRLIGFDWEQWSVRVSDSGGCEVLTLSFVEAMTKPD